MTSSPMSPSRRSFHSRSRAAPIADMCRSRSGPAAEVGGGFRTAMADALKGVSQAQNESTRLQREVALDNPTVSLEETMVAMNKAQLGFQATVQVRNRLVSAYTDIMNMQV